MGKKLGYLRVSTRDQDLGRQRDGLASICDELREEKASAAKRRPIFDALLSELAEGDTLVVWDLDRAFRSTVEAITTAEQLQAQGVHFQIVTMNVDTSTPAGELFYSIMASFAQFERKNLSRRTLEGLAAARKRGSQLGRPTRLNAEQLSHIRQRLANGESKRSVAKSFNVHPRTLMRAGF